MFNFFANLTFFSRYKTNRILDIWLTKKKLTNKVALIVLDGFGIAPPSDGNAVTSAKINFYNDLLVNFPNGKLIASGESVGLPAGEVGNTEVGHLTMGAGRVVLQELLRINKDIKNGIFFENKAFLLSLQHIQENKSNLHIIGLLSNGNVHSSKEHLYGLLEFCKQRGVKNVYLHMILDGRDSPTDDGAKVIAELEKYLADNKFGEIATVSGRYYSMDRDQRWDRTELSYLAMIAGNGPIFATASLAVSDSYKNKIGDEFIMPSVISKNGKPVGTVSDNDSVIFFNFRVDRPRQLTMAFTMPELDGFARSKVLKKLFFTTMTRYQDNIPVSAVAYDKEKVAHTLSEIISKRGLSQLVMSESEKERFVTYCFSGLREKKLDKMDVNIVPSSLVATYDKKPEMSLPELVSSFLNQFNKYDFVLLNIANPDMVAHTGNFKKTVKAIENVNWALSKIVQKVYDEGATAIITSDHGNSEELLTYDSNGFFVTTKTGDRNTDHSGNPVPVIIVNQELKGQKLPISDGTLCDIAPTVLGLMQILVNKNMTGRNLLASKEVGNE